MNNFAFNDKIFIFELQVGQQSLKNNTYEGIMDNGIMLLRVPYSRIQSEIQRLQRIGTKILDIYPISDIKYQQRVLGKEANTSSQEVVSSIDNQETISNNNYIFNSSIDNQETIANNTPWWVEILTEFPRCLYYFGPFDSEEEAINHQFGYQDDLEKEGAKGINITIKQCLPKILTQEL